MGEYAKRIQDGEEVKIGTCETLYYLRYDQRNQVDYDFGNDKWYWRIPTPEEDGRWPGDYETTPLREGGYIPYMLKVNESKGNELAKAMMESVGIVQTRVESLGLLVNLPCYHGLQLPENGNGMKFFWNGKRDALYLSFLANYPHEMRVGFQCAACGEMWSAPFMDALPMIKSLWMKLRLLRVCTEYWGENNLGEPCDYSVEYDGMEIFNLSGRENDWHVYKNDEPIAEGNWAYCRNAFLQQIEVPAENDEQAWIHASQIGKYGELYEIKEMKERYL